MRQLAVIFFVQLQAAFVRADSARDDAMLIGNSLTRDAVPALMDETVDYHVDCGVSLPYLSANPDAPGVATSTLVRSPPSPTRFCDHGPALRGVHAMPPTRRVDAFFAKPVIPVLWDVGDHANVIANASSVLLQGGAIADLPRSIEQIKKPPLSHLRLLVHIDLLVGLENNEAGLELLAQSGVVDGVATVNSHLVKPARRLGFRTVVRVFLTDSRALERGIRVAGKCGPNVIEVLPAAAVAQASSELRSCSIPFMAGGLARPAEDVRVARDCGSLAISSTRPELWRLNS